MEFMFRRLWDYSYSPAHSVYEVLKGDKVLGIVENWKGQAKWKAFTGSGFSCHFLSEHRSKESAAEAILWALI